jgi:hypothetical protein
MAHAARPGKSAKRFFGALGSGVVIGLIPTIAMKEASFIWVSLSFFTAALMMVPWRTWQEENFVDRLVIPVMTGGLSAALFVWAMFTVAISIGPAI